jgi:hypothetical protein
LTDQNGHLVPIVVFEGKDDNKPTPYSLPLVDLEKRLARFDERQSKDGRLWSPVTYRPGTTRGKANVDWVHMLVLDIDHGDLPLDLLSGLEWFGHTTFSHTPDAPRWRVVLPLAAPVSGADWPEFWLRANAHFGGCIDPQTKDSSRIFYLPSCLPGAPHEARQQHGEFLDPASLPEIARYDPPPVMPRRRVQHATYLQDWATRFVEGKADELGRMGQGQRNAAANRTAYLLAGLAADPVHALEHEWVASALYAACERNGLVAEDGQRSVEATLRSGFEDGLRVPWSPADQNVVAGERSNGHVESFPAAATGGLRLDVVRMSDVQPEPIEWLWRGRFARGKPTLLMGDPGLGKSLITHWLAAHCSIGGEWPDGGTCEAGTTILFTIEDGLSDTVSPRLHAANARMERVIAVRGVVDERDTTTQIDRMFALTQHLALLEALILETHALVVVMDPITAYLGPDINSHKEADVRAVLGPLQMLAERTGVVLIMLMHLNKGTGVSALYRATGSIAFPAVARVVLGVAPDPNDETGHRRLLLPVKMNIGKGGVGIGYRIETAPHTQVLPTAIEADQPPILVWDLDPVLVDATAAMDRNGTVQELGACAEVKSALAQILADGRVTARECERQLKEAGCSTSASTITRAKKEMGVRTTKEGFANSGTWWWELPRRLSNIPSIETLVSLNPLNPLEATKASKASMDTPPGSTHAENEGFKGFKGFKDSSSSLTRAREDPRCRGCGRGWDLHGARDPISCQWQEPDGGQT